MGFVPSVDTTSVEIGTLWLTYQEKTLILRIVEYFIKKSEEEEARNILGALWQHLKYYILQMEKIFDQQGIAYPNGYKKEDVNLEAPKLFDNGFDIMFVRILKEVSMGMYTINRNMAYNDDVMQIYKGLTRVTHDIYELATLYLLQKGILALPPKVTMPKTTEYIKDKSYLRGFDPFSDKRPLNDIEIGFLHHAIETNNIGFQLMTGFAQCAQNYFENTYELIFIFNYIND
ncbi:DUF3231 family protein [Bacillus sp. ISL-46]|nr:DUF3231 family protein [Bacillus sp. ISL-46]MBT2744406.1 DUF3231 family protein [Bacillus sp. ISL-77]